MSGHGKKPEHGIYNVLISWKIWWCNFKSRATPSNCFNRLSFLHYSWILFFFPRLREKNHLTFLPFFNSFFLPLILTLFPILSILFHLSTYLSLFSSSFVFHHFSAFLHRSHLIFYVFVVLSFSLSLVFFISLLFHIPKSKSIHFRLSYSSDILCYR